MSAERLGILADIHEEVESLAACVAALRSAGVARFVMLGDVFDTGKRLDQTVALLRTLDSVGVWGNHDIGFVGPDLRDWLSRRYAPETLAYFDTLEPWLEAGGARFQHIEPYLDSNSVEDLFSYGGEGGFNAERTFAACPAPRMFMGHLHRWAFYTAAGPAEWRPPAPMRFQDGVPALAVVHGVQQGWCAFYEPETGLVQPVKAA